MKQKIKPSNYNKQYTQEEIEYIFEKWGNVSINSMATFLNRTPNAVRQKALKLGCDKFLNSGDRYVTKHQLFVSLGLASAGDTYKNTSWIKNRGLPTHKLKRLNQTFDVVYIDEFWEWAEKNQSFLDFSRFEKYMLGPEPEWVNQKRKRDYNRAQKIKATPWTKQEDERLLKLLREYKYYYVDLSKMLGRTEGGIQRRICELGYKERPLKADNMVKWTDEELDTLGAMINQGYSYEDMSNTIGKSSKALRGLVYRYYLTESLDKVRKYLNGGTFGVNRPLPKIRQKNLTSVEQKEFINSQLSIICGAIEHYASEQSKVAADYSEYFQKDMCQNWDNISGCTKDCSSCDDCNEFKRIQPQYCVVCGSTFYERKQNKVCSRCRQQRIKAARKKYAVLLSRGRIGA